MHNLTLLFATSEIPALARMYRLGKREAPALDAGRDGRERGWLTHTEFMKIAEWKSGRPKQRYLQNSETDVANLTREAFGTSNEVEAVVILTCLNGVRVRTATAILHVAHPKPYPLLDVWAMTALGIPRAETYRWDDLVWLQMWPRYVRFCRELVESTGHDLRTIDRALWAFGEDQGSKRRRRIERFVETDRSYITVVKKSS